LYICVVDTWNMGNFSKMQEEKKERKEKDNTRREKLASYFFDLSKLSFAGLVIGGIVSIKPEMDVTVEGCRVVFGIISTFVLARMGNVILK